MIISRIRLVNWRNFQEIEASLSPVTYVLGKNASGKSNFLDAFRFLRDVAKPTGGGLQKAILDRGTLKKVRCLHARTKTDVGIEVEVKENTSSVEPSWKYALYFNVENKGSRSLRVRQEQVWKRGEEGQLRSVLSRPDKDDKADPERLTQTALEQIQANSKFRELADFFSQIAYLHVVPQLLKFGDIIGGRRLDDDPFGQAFLEKIASTSEKTRKNRLALIEGELKKIVPQLEALSFERDHVSGTPHLEARYKHHRPNGAIQREDQFSDGTLRLIALFWLLIDGESLLLLEEPELSLNEEIIQRIPALFESVQKKRKKRRQIIVTTHSRAMMDNAGIGAESLITLERTDEGTRIGTPSDAEIEAMLHGFTPAETVMKRTVGMTLDQLDLSL